MMDEDILKKDQSPVSWRVFGEGNYFVCNSNLEFCSVDKLSNMYILYQEELALSEET